MMRGFLVQKTIIFKFLKEREERKKLLRHSLNGLPTDSSVKIKL